MVPLLKPLLMQAGVDLIHFGAVMTTNLSMAHLTTPRAAEACVQRLFQVSRPVFPAQRGAIQRCVRTNSRVQKAR